jgi:hypothetical protein
MPKRKAEENTLSHTDNKKFRQTNAIPKNFMKTEFENRKAVLHSSEIRSKFSSKEIDNLINFPVNKWSKTLLGKFMSAICVAHCCHADDADMAEAINKFGQFALGK